MKRRLAIVFILVIITGIVSFIWWHSLQPGAVSHAESRHVLSIVLFYTDSTWFAPYLDDRFIRRLAHLTEYASLGLSMSVLSLVLSGKQRTIWVLLAGICIASIDEYIQQFAGDRTSTWHDVAFDMIGCCAGIMIVAALRRLVRGYRG